MEKVRILDLAYGVTVKGYILKLNFNMGDISGIGWQNIIDSYDNKQKRKYELFVILNCKQNNKAILPITQLTVALQGLMTTANINLLTDIIHCFYCVRYGTTTQSLSRYSTYSLRTLLRFFTKDHEWVAIRLCLLRAFVFSQQQHYIVAMDEVVEGKSGKLTHGLSRFYNSVAQKPVAGVCFFGLSLIEVSKRCSYFLSVKQVTYTQEDKKRISQQKANREEAQARAAKGQALAKGRKKGSKNKPRQTNQTASFRAFKHVWQE